MSLVVVLVGTVALLGDFFLRMSYFGRGDSERKSGQMGVVILVVGFIFALLSPIIAKIIQLAISRRREFMADAGAISITHQPDGLISALKKISADHEPLEAANKATAHLYIANPFKDKARGAVNWFSGLFNTHPKIEDRINALSKMA
jgi:heat shock protein HtpX